MDDELTLWVTGMSGEDCRNRVSAALRTLPGVRRVLVDLSRNEVTLCGEVDRSAAVAALAAAGFGVSAFPVPEARGVG